ncbi:hypothetical protein BCF33_2293 [Hasllibacter halocynthiae]|uniref:DUF2062 domain-containing protein n=1 Tax=Hasllibacter halocynthiae TaxID=595589 RepID=A0A2T0X3E1_9RHOB|nr:DUF2062 domain-containing protein [Hasllibacter halocynthiae]PRY93425.1 hypothetical protein BCF33_2293 [Hasllibacter halocynthiae]
MFRRRNPRSYARTAAEAVWPRGGWARAITYMKHRLRRLPDPPERIARGVMAGVIVCFTPLFGLHFVLAALLAKLLRGNIPAAILGTFFGNPLTYVPIAYVALETGHLILRSRPGAEPHGALREAFEAAGSDLWTNVRSVFAGGHAQWDGLVQFWGDVFFPWLVGGMAPGIACGIACYYVTLPTVAAYQKARRARLSRKVAKLAAKRMPE